MNDVRIDRESQPFALSQGGAARREAILADLQSEMSRLHRTRNARRRTVSLAVPALMLLALIWLYRTQQSAPNAPLTTRSQPSTPPVPRPFQAMASGHMPALQIVRVRTDSRAADRLRASVASSATHISDDDLLATLAALDRPAGMVRSDNRVWLTRAVADEPSAQGG
jgi:hypothetical protein